MGLENRSYVQGAVKSMYLRLTLLNSFNKTEAAFPTPPSSYASPGLLCTQHLNFHRLTELLHLTFYNEHALRLKGTCSVSLSGYSDSMPTWVNHTCTKVILPCLQYPAYRCVTGVDV